MSFLEDFMGHVVEKAARSWTSDFVIEPHSFSINCVEMTYNNFSALKVDSDGDMNLNFEIDKHDLMQDLLDEEDMINYLENNGYKVAGEE